jgi:ABC-type branched-subunit amino acid transport system substrate-binding protein
MNSLEQLAGHACQGGNMRARSFRVAALLVAVAMAAAGCSSSSKNSSSSGGTTAPKGLTASARGVTADTIKIGFSYPDLEALAKTGLIKVDSGPFGPMAQALVNDINAQGGVNGRKLQMFLGKYSVLGNDEQLATCTKFAQDDKVFAVLGGFIGDTNLCVTQQYSTTLISTYGSGFNQIALGKARAPWATPNAADERAVQALVKILAQQGKLTGKTIGVYGTLSASKPLIDLTVKDLHDAGFTVKDTAINDVSATDTLAFNAQDKVIGNRFKDEGIDTVIVQVTVPPGTNWDNIAYYPSMFSPQTSLVVSGAYTNPYNKFPIVAGLGVSADPNAGFDTPAMKHCREVWKQATGKDIKPISEEQKEGKSSGAVAMATACTALQMFVAAAKAAGPNLTPQTWQKALESLGTMQLPFAPIASFAPGKPDGQNSFELEKINPDWKQGSSEPQLLPVGQQLILNS